MSGSDSPASHLQRETERQNRIYQDAIARKKNLARAEDARAEPPFAEPVGRKAANRFAPQQESSVTADAGSAPFAVPSAAAAFPDRTDTPASADDPAQAWGEKLHRIPDIRSALIPLQSADEIAGWSKPFSLVRADMEPWLSFYKGYTQSRLFLDGALSRVGEAHAMPPMDFAVRALLELKQVDVKAILEPAVQINGQVEYAELEDGLRACRSEVEARSLVSRASDAHDALLRKAVAKGREMGSLLYDALMGEGHVNLINAWENVHQRRPSVEELHRMLTTGHTKISAPRKTSAEPVADAMPDVYADRIEAAAVAAFGPVVQKNRVPSPAREAVTAPAHKPADAPAAKAKASWVEKRLEALSPQRRILVPVIVAAAACAAVVALGLAGVI